MSNDLHYLSIAEASRLIAAKPLSPVELTRAFLERIEAFDYKLYAYLTVTAELAMAQARAAEKDILSNDPVAATDARVVEVDIVLDASAPVAMLTNLTVEVEIQP